MYTPDLFTSRLRLVAVISEHLHAESIEPQKLGSLPPCASPAPTVPASSSPTRPAAPPLPTPFRAPPRRSSPAPQPPHAKPRRPTPAASPNSTADPTTATGNDALGQGNVSIAFASFFPRPKPDLSPYAAGAAGDVILDITITADGKVTDIKLTQSLSPAIDQTVIATVRQWTFRPATKDGQPITSEQELHFHYERA